MIGARIGRLVVVGEAEKKPGGRNRRWDCLCDCGGRVVADAGNLRKWTTKSCGCLRRENGRKSLQKHGDRFHPAYPRWAAMRTRCYSEKCRGYKNYGGRGITVCDEWRETPTAFLQWADRSGFRPDLQLDREDNDKGYSPDNCRWVTRSANNRNRRPFAKRGA